MVVVRGPSADQRFMLRKIGLFIFPILIAFAILALQFLIVRSAGELTVEIVAGYNLVVDSNVKSPSTFGPEVATVMGKFCNTTSAPLTNVYGYIGNSTTHTPGVYPVFNSADLDNSHVLYNTGIYSFTHMGGRTGTADATRFIGNLAPGQCNVQYWHIIYPQCENIGGRLATPPCTGDAVWGLPTDPTDDLKLRLDMWAKADGSIEATPKMFSMTLRNEISAMANKIEPNPKGAWFNTKGNTVVPGDVITSNGVHYELGRVNKGFDNNNDGLFDFNAWMQPIGRQSFDPNCFRLIRTTGLLTVSRSGGNPPMIVNFTDQLYFTNLPSDNNGITGNVYYTFMALGGPCSVDLSPYQEVASGADNEKFNADFGTGIPPVMTYAPAVSIDKLSSPNIVSTGTIYTYTLPFANSGTGSAGLFLSTENITMPLVISDTLPVGMYYVGGSANCSIDGATTCDANRRFSTNSGSTWTTIDPGTTQSLAGAKVIIQWWLNAPLPPKKSGYAWFKAQVPGIAPSSPFVENRTCASFGSGASFTCDSTTTLIRGTLKIGDQVFRDENLDSLYNNGDTGIAGVTVSLYWDKNNDDKLDQNDVPIAITTTNSSGGYLFDLLPNGDYLVAVSETIPPIPTGYRHTTNTVISVTLAGSNVLTADFGFGPALDLRKTLVDNPAYEGRTVRYVLTVQNLRPGGGESVAGGCRFKTWATVEASQSSGLPTTKSWLSDQLALSAAGPDGSYAYSDYTNAINNFAGTGYSVVPQSASISKVEAIFSIYVDGGQLVDDNLAADLYFNDVIVASKTFTVTRLNTYGIGQAKQAILSWDISGTRSWSWGDFAGNLDLMAITNKSGSKDGAVVHMDALGFYITTGSACPVADPADILNTVPLTDTYDRNLLTFQSAVPPVSTHDATNGQLSWGDIGPIYPGQAKSVQVNFLAKEPSPQQNSTINNTAGATKALFPDNTKANNDYANATGTLIPTSVITGVVFSDLSGNGWSTFDPITGMDTGDLGIPGVKVGLYLCAGQAYDDNKTAACPSTSWTLVMTTTADASGKYSFTGLPNGYYYAKVDTSSLLGSFTPTTDADAIPSVNHCTDNSCTTTDNEWQDLAASIKNMSYLDYAVGNKTNINFGYSISASVFGTVWQDSNNDGKRQSGENGISGVTVYLVDCGSNNICGDSNDITTTLTTNAAGMYSATNLQTGDRGKNFEIRVNTSTLPPGGAWTQTADPNGAPLSSIYQFTAIAGKVSGSYDFGYYRSGAYRIGDTVFADWNGDGNQNTGEEGLSGITVWLYNDSNQNGVIETNSDALIYTTTTNTSGIYTFSNLYAGSYVVKVNESQLPTIWEDYLQTKDPDQNGVCTSCNEFGAAAVSSALPANTAMDFGYKPAGFAKLGDRVWKDTDADGIQDPGETGIPNITVRIYQDDGQTGVFEPSLDALVAEVSTDANGNYLFEVLPGVKYLVYVDTSDPQMLLDTYGKKYALTTNNNYKPVLLSSGQIYLEADFGFAPGAYLGDFIWQDNDGDGSQDPGEPGIPLVAVELYSDTNRNGAFDSEDVLLATTTTNASGIYSFTGIISGAYVVKVASPGNTFTLTGDPDAPTVPCSAGGCNGEDAVALKPGQVNLSADFGYKPQYSLGDFVWLDGDKDGVQDPGEPGIGGVRLCLTSPCNSGNLSQTTTDSDGYYTFGGLNSGNYTVYVDIDTLATDTRNPTYDFDGTGTPNQATINVNGNIKTADFGYFYSGDGSLSGTVFMDTGDDGHAFSSGVDLPIQNVPVYLYNSAGKLVASTLTGVDGAYTFNNLPTGQDFTVVVDNLSPIISGLTLNYEPDWSDDGDQKCEAGEGCNNQATLPPSASGKDFGFFALMDCGDLPDTYNYRTVLAKEGPCHIADPNPSNQVKLGSQLDYESDGQPSAGANADDLQHPTNQSNDEDGVAVNFDTSWTPGPTGQTINITVNSNNAYVAAWFDWNNDGDFITVNGAAYDTGEYIYFGKLNSGTNQVIVSIPSGSACCSGDPKTLFARFRVYKGLTPPPIIAPTGLVANGEVEDYQWFFTDHPTSVNLLDFNVTTDLSKVILSWRTANELGAYGFNIYRSSKPDGEPIQINPVMIDSQNPGGIGITDYTYYDPDILPDVTYYYWLEFVDTTGSSWFGPVQITLGSNSLFLPTVRK